MTNTRTHLVMITLDCADPGPVSTFWPVLRGWQVAANW